MIVVLTEAAIADLVAIGRYIKADNPQRAETFVAELESRCHQLGTMPKAFPLVPRHEGSGRTPTPLPRLSDLLSDRQNDIKTYRYYLYELAHNVRLQLYRSQGLQQADRAKQISAGYCKRHMELASRR